MKKWQMLISIFLAIKITHVKIFLFNPGGGGSVWEPEREGYQGFGKGGSGKKCSVGRMNQERKA